MDISEMMDTERQRLKKRLEELLAQQVELRQQELAVMNELAAIQAYVDIKLGKVAVKGAASVTRRGVTGGAPRSRGSRQQLLALIASFPSGVRRAELLVKCGAKGNIKMERSVSSSLVALKARGRVTLTNGVYEVTTSGSAEVKSAERPSSLSPTPPTTSVT